jgi:hypothetical protein
MCSEEVTVQSVGLPVDGPTGPVEGAIVLRERHQDGTTEDKTFVPGYGEFLTGGDGDLEATVLVVPHDALGGPVLAELDTLAAGATGLLRVTPDGDWAVASSTVAEMTSAWDAYRGSAVPAMLDTRMTDLLDALTRAAAARDGARIQEAAIVVAQAALDLQLRYLAPIDVDTACFNLWTSRIEADGAAGEPVSRSRRRRHPWLDLGPDRPHRRAWYRRPDRRPARRTSHHGRHW